MKFIGFLVGIGLSILPTASYANSWFGINMQDSFCSIEPDDVTPYAAVTFLRDSGIIPGVTENDNPDGSVASITLNYVENGNPLQVQFFTSMDGCQRQLDQDIKDGVVVDPNSMK